MFARIRTTLAVGVLILGVTAATAGTLPATAAVPDEAVPVASNPPDGVFNQGDRTLDFDHGWKFQLVNTADTTDPSGMYGNSSNPLAAAVDFPDASWRTVTLPHDWSIEQLPQPSNGNATGYFPGGLGWYRKTFTVPTSMDGKRISIDFDGVYMNSYVYLNGALLGNRPYGYVGFSFDITDLVHTDGTPNVLAVVVQNKQPSSRWYSGSGITRNVHLTVTDPVHVARLGTFVTTPDLATTIESGYADVHVQTQLGNETGHSTSVDVVSTVRDAKGRPVAAATSSDVTVGDSATDAADIKLADPHLWSTTDPYLYTLTTQVVQHHQVIDTYDTTFGVRWLTFDPAKGVFLNGQHLKLQGVDLHNDQGALGSVNNYDALWRQMSILKSQGVNSFRTSHNPPSPEMIDVCQRLGIVMMVEAFDAWTIRKVTNDYSLYFNQWSDSDIAEMVNEAKNSPAVIMWSIGNEIPGWGTASFIPIEQRLISDVKALDTTRPVVAGSDRYRGLPTPGSAAETMLLNLDGLGLNYNPALVVDGLHARYPTKFFFESESSSEESARGVYQDPDYVNTGENYTPGKRLPSSYDNNLASWTMSDEYGLKKDRDRQYFAGQFIWSGFDYIGEPTPYSQFPVKASSFGAIDTAGFPKDAYYVFQSQWTSKPMVHLVPMNWTDYKPGQNVQVWAYSNVKSVELFLNGQSLGTKSFDAKTSTDGIDYLETTECSKDDKNYTTGTCPGSYESPNGSSGKLHLTWNVPFQPGQLVAVARDGDGQQVARDEVDTAGKPYTVRLSPDKTMLAADGKSLSYVTADVVDEHGVVVPDAANAITFDVSGAGSFVGADNGKEDDAEGYQATTHYAFNGKVLAIVEARQRAGLVTITATGDGLAPATTTLHVVASAPPVAGPEPDPIDRTFTTPPAPTGPVADAGYSGSPTSVPAGLLDGNTASGGWSNFYNKSATNTLPSVSLAHQSEWVSVTWPAARQVSSVVPYFTISANRMLPSSLTVSYWNGSDWVATSNQQVQFAAASNQPTTVTFDPVSTTAIRLDLTSPAPNTPTGFMQITELQTP